MWLHMARTKWYRKTLKEEGNTGYGNETAWRISAGSHPSSCRGRGLRELQVIVTVALATAALVLGPVAVSGASKKGRAAGGHSIFSKTGAPNLKGVTIDDGKGSASPQPSDTVAYIQQQILIKWGATSPKLTNSSGPSLAAAVAAGKLTVCAGPFSAFVDSHLLTFGPSQSRLDYVLLVKPSIRSVSQLKGKIFAVTEHGSEDDVLLTQFLRQKGLSASQVHVVDTGSYPSVLTSFISGSADAIFAHAADTLTIKQKHVGYRVLTSSSKIAPLSFDSVMAARPGWVKSHEQVATAIDLAWLYAAKIADTDPGLWVRYSKAYVGGAFAKSYVKAAYSAYKATHAWPDNKSGFTARALVENYKLGVAGGNITMKGLKLGDYATMRPWESAIKRFDRQPDMFP